MCLVSMNICSLMKVTGNTNKDANNISELPRPKFIIWKQFTKNQVQNNNVYTENFFN